MQLNRYPEAWSQELEKARETAVRRPSNEHHSVSADEVMQHDFKVKRLLSGDIGGYPSPSEARMALLCCLAGYGLSDADIQYVMGQSSGLHWNKKKHLQSIEIRKAQSYATTTRRLLKHGNNA